MDDYGLHRKKDRHESFNFVMELFPHTVSFLYHKKKNVYQGNQVYDW